MSLSWRPCSSTCRSIRPSRRRRRASRSRSCRRPKSPRTNRKSRSPRKRSRLRRRNRRRRNLRNLQNRKRPRRRSRPRHRLSHRSRRKPRSNRRHHRLLLRRRRRKTCRAAGLRRSGQGSAPAGSAPCLRIRRKGWRAEEIRNRQRIKGNDQPARREQGGCEGRRACKAGERGAYRRGGTTGQSGACRYSTAGGRHCSSQRIAERFRRRDLAGCDQDRNRDCAADRVAQERPFQDANRRQDARVDRGKDTVFAERDGRCGRYDGDGQSAARGACRPALRDRTAPSTVACVSALSGGAGASYRLPSGSVLEVKRSQFRMGEQWYDVGFRCEVNENATKVISFAFEVGKPVPRSEWRKRGFPE